MGKLIGIFACFLIVALDVAAGILGIKAESAQNQETHLMIMIFECKKPSHEAYILGLWAASLLGAAHVLALLLGGCTVCAKDEVRKESHMKHLSVACLIFTWIILAVGLLMLGMGITSNNKSRISCGFNYHHFLSIGGILCILHALFSVAYYVTSVATLSV